MLDSDFLTALFFFSIYGFFLLFTVLSGLKRLRLDTRLRTRYGYYSLLILFVVSLIYGLIFISNDYAMNLLVGFLGVLFSLSILFWVGAFVYSKVAKIEYNEHGPADETPQESAEVASDGSKDVRRPKVSWKKALTIATVLVLFDSLIMGVPGLGLLILFVLALKSLVGCTKRDGAVVLFIYATSVIITLGAFSMNNKSAASRADLVIAAVESYKEDSGAYPEGLKSLVPKYLGKIPKARYGSMWNRFNYIYSDSGPTLMYTAFPPYGRRIYYFEGGKWNSID